MSAFASRFSTLCILAGFALVAAAGDAPPVDPRVELAKKIPGGKVDELKPSPIPGIFELHRNGDVGYVTGDGRYFLSGDLYDIQADVNLSEMSRMDTRRKLLATIPDSETVTFAPPNPKYTITVFTDVDCGYCRKLHSEIKDLNRLGVRVRYVFYPQSGPGSESWKEAEAVWCSADRNDALTRAKKGEHIKAENCGPTPVARQYELGHKLNMHGTPGIFTANGDYVTGYLPAAQLVKQLQSFETK
ncbi:MAG TPA: DsbC family protein [Steroidobacteraceae bacterium]|nr:DsbC family protein [Steroidobacteraceae bacterium]